MVMWIFVFNTVGVYLTQFAKWSAIDFDGIAFKFDVCLVCCIPLFKCFQHFSIHQGCYKYLTASKTILQFELQPFRLIPDPSFNQYTAIASQSCHQYMTASLPISTQDTQTAKLYKALLWVDDTVTDSPTWLNIKAAQPWSEVWLIYNLNHTR